MSPADILRVLAGTAPGDWLVNRPAIVTQTETHGPSHVRAVSAVILSPRGRGGLVVLVTMGGAPLAPAAWSRAAFDGVAPLAGLVEVQSVYRGPLFRTHRAVSPDGWGGIPLPCADGATVERLRFHLLRIIAQRLATPGFDDAWARSGLTVADAAWEPIEAARQAAPAPAWSPIP